MFWTGDGKLLLVSCADVTKHMPNFNRQFYSALVEESWKWPFKLPTSLWCATIKKKINQQRLGTTDQMESNFFTSFLIRTLPVPVFVLRLTFCQSNQIKNPNYVIFLPFVFIFSKFIQDKYSGYSQQAAAYIAGAVYDSSLVLSAAVGILIVSTRNQKCLMITFP